MNRTYIQEVQKEIGNTIKVQGFIENLRNSKYMAFIVLKDITGKLQITVEKEDHPELVDTIDRLTPDSVITVTGKVMENDYVKMGGIEMIPESIEIESIADALPIVRKEIAATKKKKAVERSSIDPRYQLELLQLVKRLNIGTLASIHDLNLAAAFCDRLYVIDHGRIIASGTPREVLTVELLRDVFGVDALIDDHPLSGYPRITWITQA